MTGRQSKNVFKEEDPKNFSEEEPAVNPLDPTMEFGLHKYRMIGDVVEAMLFGGSNAEMHAIYGWVESSTPGMFDIEDRDKVPGTGVTLDTRTDDLVITTLSETIRVSPGEYLVRTTDGEFSVWSSTQFKTQFEREK